MTELGSGAFPLLEPVEFVVGEPAPEAAAGARAIVSEATPWAALRPFFDQIPTLEAIFTTSAGYDHVKDRYPGVGIVNARGAHGGSTAEMAMAMLLAHAKRLPEFVHTKDSRTWPGGVSGVLLGKSVLALGAGDLGQEFARRARAFDMDVTVVGQTARPGVRGIAEVPSLLPAADAVVVLLPLTASTRGLVDADFLAAMKDGAVLVNVGRGPIVDTDALVAELARGRILAALDVTDPEPLPPDHRLWAAQNLIITPHIGGFAEGAFGRIIQVMGAQMEMLARGQTPTNLVDA